jgi:uncharacterized protein (TIGR02271 family)
MLEKNSERENQQSNQLSGDHLTIPVIEEHLVVGKKAIETGKVIISKKVHSQPHVVDIPVVEEEVDVQRIPVNQYIDTTPPAIRYEGEKTIIPILKEVLVVEKKLVLVEEVHITRKQSYHTITQQEVLRQEDISINRVNDDPASI